MQKKFGSPLDSVNYQQPRKGVLPTKKWKEDGCIVKNTLDNHFQGFKPKFSLNLISAPHLVLEDMG